MLFCSFSVAMDLLPNVSLAEPSCKFRHDLAGRCLSWCHASIALYAELYTPWFCYLLKWNLCVTLLLLDASVYPFSCGALYYRWLPSPSSSLFFSIFYHVFVDNSCQSIFFVRGVRQLRMFFWICIPISVVKRWNIRVDAGLILGVLTWRLTTLICKFSIIWIILNHRWRRRKFSIHLCWMCVCF